MGTTKDELKSIDFKFTHRTAPQYFTRESPLNFQNTILLILRMIKKSIKAELMDYFYGLDKQLDIPSRQAFTQAREKIKYTAFKVLFEKSCEIAISGDDCKLFKGYRLCAVDGTSFAVGNMSKLTEYFGKSTTIPGKAMCRISGIVDILENCIIDASVAPFSTGERVLAIEQIQKLNFVLNALFLFDRGYWSPKLVDAITENGQKFLMRISKENKDAATKKGLRVYSFTLPSKNEEILVTNLSQTEMSDDELGCLYMKRWGIETKYLELKARLQIDKLSGESANIILQDIYSALYISNLVAFTCSQADEIIQEKTDGKDNKYKQKANRTTCISVFRRRFVDICLLDDDLLQSAALDKLYHDICKDVSYIEKSKPRPRNKRQLKQSRRIYSKPIL